MGKSGLDIQQSVKWIGGLLAAWLLLLLPVRAADLPAVSEQAFLTTASSENWDTDSDYSSSAYHDHRIAVVSPRAGFSFLPSVVFLPSLFSAFCRTLCIELLGQSGDSYFWFGFLRPIFEHQIAINAP
ncbi:MULTISPECIES: hypothetical protein [Spirosoma]|uniref:Uncharacterized protein n=1 Tax=Spirosoma sordidisoli TaxID=2502893 RepID=A0A4Q2UDD6_9BACT|nr:MULTISPECIES: hypothetical protein [Spirosoma]RYC67065.1 hypothetical protein EQG79_25620 [Spirosoma sordidisoli]RYC67193.1 hypothetical protein EQG79_26330 [Spirosoma sordidisoli]